MKINKTRSYGRNYITEMKEDLGMIRRRRSPMMESILYDDEDFELDDEYEDDTTNEPIDDTVSVEDSINQIRQIALKAIAELADDPTDSNYILMKKVWSLCDKAVEDRIVANNKSDDDDI